MYPNTTRQDSSGGLASMVGYNFDHAWTGDGSVWEAFRRTCHPNSNARRLFSSIKNDHPGSAKPHINLHSSYGSQAGPGGDFLFVAETANQIDFCDHPSEHYNQGHFFSDFRTISVLYPIFSPAKGRGFADIRIPSHYYYGATKRYTYGYDAINMEKKVVDDMEVAWEEKSDKIFWRGATTGGGSSPAGFAHQYQRHRLLRNCSAVSKLDSHYAFRFLRAAHEDTEVNRTIVFADPPSSDIFHAATVAAKAVNSEIMDVAFVRSVGYYPDGQESLTKRHRFGDAVSLGGHWAHKYLLDVDGQSYSARFLAFLASDSAVVKATVYQEYYNDWIQPW